MTSWLASAPPDEVDAGPVRLRRWRPADAETITALVEANLEHLRPWMPWAQQMPTVEEERSWLARMDAAWWALSDFGYAVELPEAGPIGGMGLHTRQGPRTLEIGYWIAAAHTGRGYATAAAGALTGAAFALAGVDRVEIRCDEANHPSAAVPRKLGFRMVRFLDREPSAPAETGRFMIWAKERDPG